MPIDLDAAVRYNRRAASRVGWADEITEVERLLRTETDVGRRSFPRSSPGEADFATAVAEWQRDRGLVEDGKLGPATWRRMRGRSDGVVTDWKKGRLRGGLLAGFDFDDASLKPAHRKWLAGFVGRIPTLPTHDIFLVGMTDKSGGAEYNLRLSRRRSRAVHRYLRDRMPYSSHARLHPVGAGEHFAQASTEKAAGDRGVAVAYEISPSPEPLPGWLFEMQRPQPQTRFYARCAGGVAGSSSLGIASLKLTELAFLISDGFWTQRFLLVLGGGHVGVSKGPIKGIGFSANLGGPWHTFALPVERTVNDFSHAYATMSSASASGPAGTAGFGICDLRFERPSFRFKPFALGPSISLSFGSADAGKAFGGLEQLSRWAVRGGGPSAAVQRRLKNGVKPGPATMP
jgi:outer membrane protein OmpA-like peptidoglycan-associated protein